MRNVTLALISIVLTCAGCTSEVDKCVNSQVKGWEAEKEREAEVWKLKKEFESNESQKKIVDPWEVVEQKDIRRKEEIEASARIMCLQIIKER